MAHNSLKNELFYVKVFLQRREQQSSQAGGVSNIRIAIATHYYPPHMGGIELVAQNHARRLGALGHDVTVVTSNIGAEPETSDAVRVVRIAALNPLESRGVPQPIFSPMLLWAMARAVRRADVVHIHDVFYASSLAAGIFAKVFRKPLVLTQHIMYVRHKSGFVNFAQKIAYATNGRFLFAKSAVIFTINDDVTDFLRTRSVAEHKIRRLPNGVDTQLFFPANAAQKLAARKKFGLPLTGDVVLFVGRFVAKKGFDKVVAARSKDYTLALAGGDFAGKPPKGVVTLGKLPQAELAELYHTADLFVLPSTGEGFPLALQEAMISGLPIITTDDPGYASYGLDKTLVRMLPSPTKTSVKSAIDEILADKPLRTKMAAYSAEYAKRFAWEHVIAELDKTYRILDKDKS
jgi:glycosyltransferase involved in cell wall biosynthesis